MFTLQLIADSGLFVLIWLVQLIIYPSFFSISRDSFIAWHRDYTRKISFIVGPLIFLQVAVEAVQFVTSHPRWLRLILISMAILVTWKVSVPCHKKLSSAGRDVATISHLNRTNWFRTALWTLLFLQSLAMSW